MVLKVEVKGLSELEAALEELGQEAGEKQLRMSITAAWKPIKARVRALAPMSHKAHWVGLKSRGQYVQPGWLRDHGFRVQKSRNERFAVSSIYRYSGAAFYGKFFELGTSKMKAQPILTRAFDENGMDALEAFKEKLRARIEIVRQKHGGA